MADVRLGVAIDARGARAGARAVNNALKSITGTVRRVGRGIQAAGRTINGFTNSLLNIRTAVLGAGIGLLASQVIEASDALTLLNARLDLVSDTTAEAVRANELLFEVSQRNSRIFEETADLYTRLARSTKNLNISQDRLVAITNSVAQSLVISGSSAESAQAALVQFGQGLQSGVLRGEELNSVLEQAPRLAELLADGLGVTTGQLRDLGAAGALTSDRIVEALERGAGSLEEEFGQIPDTVGKALQRVRNDIFVAVGSIDTSPIAESIEEIRKAAAESNIAEDLGNAFATVAKVVAEVTRFIIENWGRIKAATIALIGASIAAWTRLEAAIKTIIVSIEGAWQSSVDFVKGLYADLVGALASALDVFPGTSDLVGDLQSFETEINSSIDSTRSLSSELAALDAEYDAILEQIDKNTTAAIRNALATKEQVKETSELDKVLEQARQRRSELGDAPTVDPKALKAQQQAAKQLAREQQTARRQIDDLVMGLEREIATFDQLQSSVVAYDVRQGKLNATLRKAGVDVEQYQERIIELSRAIDALEIEQEFGDPSAAFQQRIAELDQLTLSETARAGAIRDAEDAFFNARESLATLSAEEQANLDLASAQIELRRAEADARANLGLDTVADQYAANNALIEEQIGLLQEQIALWEQYPDSITGQAEILRLQAQIVDLQGSVRTVGDDIRASFRDSLADSIVGLQQDVTKIEDIFNNLFDSIVANLNRTFAEDISTSITSFLTPNLGDSRGGGTGSILGDLFGGIFGRRQFGGPAIANRPYIVGEGGNPELFVPGTSGQIIPDARVGGVVVNMNINTPDADSFRQSSDMIARDLSTKIQRAQRFQG